MYTVENMHACVAGAMIRALCRTCAPVLLRYGLYSSVNKCHRSTDKT